MKKISAKPIIMSALAALAFGTVTVGTTFALFTDKAETKINVQAGLVDIESSLKLVAYENTGVLTNADKEWADGVSEYTTEIGTNFKVVDHNLEITNMTPGDKVTLKVNLVNKSNVKTKYRLTAKNNAGELAKALKVQASGGTTSWTLLDAATDLVNGDEIETATVVIEFVNHDEGKILANDDVNARDNAFMGKTVSYVLGYEVVQGNAVMADSEPTGFNAYEEVVIPTENSTGTGYVWEKEVAAGTAKLSGETAYDDEVTVSLGTDVENSNFTFDGGSTTVSYDIHVDRNANDTTAVNVQVLLEKGLAGVTIYHEKDDGTVEEIPNTYNADTGYVTFQSSSFSPYHFIQIPKDTDMVMVSTAEELQTELNRLSDDELQKGKIGLAKDIAASEIIEVKRDVEIYGFGHKVSTSAKRGLWLAESGINVVLSDLEFACSSTCERSIQVNNNVFDYELYINNVTTKGCMYYAINYCSNTSGSTYISDSYISGWAALNIWGFGHEIYVEDSVLEGINDKNESGWNNFATICFEADTTNVNADDYSDGNNVKIVDSKVIATETNSNIQTIVSYNKGIVGALSNKLELENCEIECERYLLMPGVANGGNSLIIDGETIWSN